MNQDYWDLLERLDYQKTESGNKSFDFATENFFKKITFFHWEPDRGNQAYGNRGTKSLNNGNFHNYYLILDNSVYYMESKSWPELAFFWNNFSFKKGGASTEGLREENKVAAKKKFEFEIWAKSLMFVLLQFLSVIRLLFAKVGLSRFCSKAQSQLFCNRIVHYTCEFFDWDLKGWSEACSYRETRQFECRH